MNTQNNVVSAQYEHEENFTQKCLCVLVLDTSGSMNGNNAIGQLNHALSQFKETIKNNLSLADHLELAIISFNSTVELIQEPTVISNVQIPELRAGGKTDLVGAIKKAQEIVGLRKDYYKSHGIAYYRPWIVVMTDGDPYTPNKEQNVNALATEIKDDSNHGKYVVSMIGIGQEVRDDILTMLSSNPKYCARIEALRFCDFFEWLANSADVLINRAPDSKLPQMPIVQIQQNEWNTLIVEANE